MAEIIITPNGPDALQAGTLVDDDGNRFVALTFVEPGVDPVIVTFTPELFEQYVTHLNRVVETTHKPETWSR